MPKFVMSDGRFTTSYQPACEYNQIIQKKYNVGSSHEYRYFLQQNAEKLMNELVEVKNENKHCPECKKEICPKCNKHVIN